jgi:uroporphyrinogen III methyltransferase/synthase
VKPLQSKRIAITRPPHKAGSFADQLRSLGAEAILLPMITIEPLDDFSELDHALQGDYDWTIFTSANAVEYLWQRLEALAISPRILGKIAVVGTATAQALHERGILPNLIPSEHTAQALFQVLADQVRLGDRRILLPQGDLASPDLANQLREAGAQVAAILAYRNVHPSLEGVSLAQPLDAITFTSPSTVHNFIALFEQPLSVIGSARVVCIGPVTAQAAQEAGLIVHRIAEPHTVEGLIDALSELFQRTATS